MPLQHQRKLFRRLEGPRGPRGLKSPSPAGAWPSAAAAGRGGQMPPFSRPTVDVVEAAPISGDSGEAGPRYSISRGGERRRTDGAPDGDSVSSGAPGPARLPFGIGRPFCDAGSDPGENGRPISKARATPAPGGRPSSDISRDPVQRRKDNPEVLRRRFDREDLWPPWNTGRTRAPGWNWTGVDLRRRRAQGNTSRGKRRSFSVLDGTRTGALPLGRTRR